MYFHIDFVHDAQPTILVRVVKHVQDRPRLLWFMRVERLLDDLHEPGVPHLYRDTPFFLVDFERVRVEAHEMHVPGIIAQMQSGEYFVDPGYLSAVAAVLKLVDLDNHDSCHALDDEVEARVN